MNKEQQLEQLERIKMHIELCIMETEAGKPIVINETYTMGMTQAEKDNMIHSLPDGVATIDIAIKRNV